MRGPLSDVRVVDLTQVLSGPYATMLLADMGADVIKIEPPTGDVSRAWGPHLDDPVRAESYGGYFASINRNKRSVVLDLHTERGINDLHQLLATADVLVENFRIGVMDRMTSTTNHFMPAIHAWSTPAFVASAIRAPVRAPTPIGRPLTSSPKPWAGSWASPVRPGRCHESRPRCRRYLSSRAIRMRDLGRLARSPWNR